MTLATTKLADYIKSVAARKSTPGGGAVAAISAAEGCALMAMVANFTTKPNNLPTDLLTRIESSNAQLLSLADADAQAFEAVMAALRGKGDLNQASINAAKVPLQVIRLILSHIEDLELMVQEGNPNLITDTGIAASLMSSSLSASELNILVNISDLDDSLVQEFVNILETVPAAKVRLETIHSQVKNSLS